MPKQITMPSGLEYWTADEVAECMPYQNYLPVGSDWHDLYSKLWGFLSVAENPTPVGGDGSDGTVEYPDGRRNLDNDDKASSWWSKLNADEQMAIMLAWKEMSEN